MNPSRTTKILLTVFLIASSIKLAVAGEVKILAADFIHISSDRWSVNVTLKHADTGWEHYADKWEVIDEKGTVLGSRTLFHPHVDEQPFTRGQYGIKIPKTVTQVYIRAHDKVHGWSHQELAVDLSKASHGQISVKAK